MPQIKAAKRKSAIEKLHKVETRLREAEEIISSITPGELAEVGFPSDPSSATVNAAYRVYAHASSLRIIREHLRTELRQ